MIIIPCTKPLRATVNVTIQQEVRTRQGIVFKPVERSVHGEVIAIGWRPADRDPQKESGNGPAAPGTSYLIAFAALGLKPSWRHESDVLAVETS